MILNPDSLLYINDKYVWSPEAASNAWSECYSQVYNLLKNNYKKLIILIGIPGAGKSTYLSSNKLEDNVVYFDSTLVSRKFRKPLVKVAFNCSKPIEAIFIDTPINICKDRNSLRTEDRKVPDIAFDKWSKLLKRPSFSEGFSKITWVTPIFIKTAIFDENLNEI